MSTLLITAVTTLNLAACGNGDANILDPAPRLFRQENGEHQTGRLPRVRRR